MNVEDSRQMMGLLKLLGCNQVDDVYQADIVILNTCSIRAKAEHKIYSELGRLKRLKEDKDLIICVAGCVAEQEEKSIIKRFPFVDIVMGPDQVGFLPELVTSCLKDRDTPPKKTYRKTGFQLKDDYQFLHVMPEQKEVSVKAFVNIQKGCDNFCAYCIVPHVRGREASRPSTQIIDEIKSLTQLGVREVTLLGQNVNSYGLKENNDITFAQLLERIASQTELKRLRFATSHPRDVSDALIEQFASNPILAPHFHLPLQSGSDRILKLMNRGYTRKHYLTIVEKLKKQNSHLCFSTDLIVGFPSETNQEFEDTLSVMKDVNFVQTYSFIYSPRPHTSAARMPDDVLLKEKQMRLKRLQDLDSEITLKQNHSDVGTVRYVLVEAVQQENQKPFMGRTEHNKIVHFTSKNVYHPGDFARVTISQANPHSLFGE
ncbi:tRNA (N6-isopentenyl adenosine(37)-C2)-methylthiotransferase MiaB [bacterium]|nr:tRNA (N6-isopentenyl adenosine(37)-C2)-methylthiotransferase MiaB [bacterium]MBU1917212.1 tRNA (N6-isopentenyl adenosine(37)-C2)-methylthiotransferase MiaB [bacterium]